MGNLLKKKKAQRRNLIVQGFGYIFQKTDPTGSDSRRNHDPESEFQAYFILTKGINHSQKNIPDTVLSSLLDFSYYKKQ